MDITYSSQLTADINKQEERGGNCNQNILKEQLFYKICTNISIISSSFFTNKARISIVLLIIEIYRLCTSHSHCLAYLIDTPMA